MIELPAREAVAKLQSYFLSYGLTSPSRFSSRTAGSHSDPATFDATFSHVPGGNSFCTTAASFCTVSDFMPV